MLAVFIIFGLYLIILPLLGMLISNILLSLSLLTALGGWRPIVMHLCVALGTSGGMWMLFSYVLEVFLPRGSLTGFWRRMDIFLSALANIIDPATLVFMVIGVGAGLMAGSIPASPSPWRSS